VQIINYLIICEEIASECLRYARVAPEIVQIPAFLNSRRASLKRLNNFRPTFFDESGLPVGKADCDPALSFGPSMKSALRIHPKGAIKVQTPDFLYCTKRSMKCFG
jgi:hypothetical protein